MTASAWTNWGAIDAATDTSAYWATTSTTSATLTLDDVAFNSISLDKAYLTKLRDYVIKNKLGSVKLAVPSRPSVYSQPTPRPRNFNRYVNASDLLEEFIAYLKTERVRQREALELPLDLFVKWLIIRACEEDQEVPNVTLSLPPPKSQPRCLGCGRWMAKQPLALHGAQCAEHYYRRMDSGQLQGDGRVPQRRAVVQR